MKTQLIKGASFMTAMLFVSMLMAPVLAAPLLPFDRLGDTTQNNAIVCSWIDGVEYGRATTSGTGYLDISTAGDETDQTTEKTGGNAGDIIQYSVGDLTGATGAFFAVAENDNFVTGSSFTGDLTIDAATNLLKIDVLASQSTVTGLPDYILIYNPTGGAVDASTYSLQVAAGSVLAIATGDIPTGLTVNNNINIPAGGSLVIDMTRWGGLGNANAVKLIRTTGSRVVDRVEYGAIAAEPENTIMTNAANPASGQEIYRIGTHQDTNQCAADFQTRVQTVVRDTTQPTVLSTVPTNTATGVLITQSVIITFSESMNTGSFTYTCSPNPGGWNPTWSTVTFANDRVTLTHTNFAYNTLYTFTITAATDLVGNALNPTPYAWTFTTELAPPVLTTMTITTDPVTITDIYVGTMPVSVQGYDQYLAPITCTPVWSDNSVGTTFINVVPGSPATADLSADGSQVSGTFTITATDGTVSDTAVLQINAYTPVLTTMTITTDPVTISDVYIGTMPVSVQGYDQIGATMACTPIWSDNSVGTTFINVVPGSPATADLNADGSQAAGTFTITATDGTVSDTAVLQINAYFPVLTTIVITPDPISVAASGSIGVSAQGYDQMVAPMACTPAWADAFGGGSFSGQVAGSPATATYNAGATAGGPWIDAITATVGSIVGAADLTITGGGAPPATQVNTVVATPHTNGGADIQLEWTEIGDATFYNVYESAVVTGTGFNFGTPSYVVPASGTGKVIYQLTGKYADANTYSWVVRAANGNGENTDVPATGGNMAYKQIRTFKTGTGSVTPDLNYLALPLKINISTNDASSLRNDIRTWGSPITGVNAIGTWNSDGGAWIVRTGVGTNFPLLPGVAYRIGAILPSVTYKIVGAHDQSVNAFTFKIGTGAVTPDLNYVALPYHTTLGFAADLRTDIRTFGNPITGVNAIGTWNSDGGAWIVRTGVGTNFPLVPGEGYRIGAILPSVAWTCPLRVPGA